MVLDKLWKKSYNQRFNIIKQFLIAIFLLFLPWLNVIYKIDLSANFGEIFDDIFGEIGDKIQVHEVSSLKSLRLMFK